jgi:hypothetical protein
LFQAINGMATIIIEQGAYFAQESGGFLGIIVFATDFELFFLSLALLVNGLYTPSASFLPRFAGERNPYQLTFCPRNKFKNLTVGIIRTHHKCYALSYNCH